MTVDDDDTTTGRLAQDTITIQRNGKFLGSFQVSMPLSFLDRLKLVRKVLALLKGK